MKLYFGFDFINRDTFSFSTQTYCSTAFGLWRDCRKLRTVQKDKPDKLGRGGLLRAIWTCGSWRDAIFSTLYFDFTLKIVFQICALEKKTSFFLLMGGRNTLPELMNIVVIIMKNCFETLKLQRPWTKAVGWHLLVIPGWTHGKKDQLNRHAHLGFVTLFSV